jgi:DNA-directed RNA polymerase specialized sigma24 family protein
MQPDDIPARAVKDAVREMSVPGLSPVEASTIGARAAHRAGLKLAPGATDTERYAAMNAAARDALSGAATKQRLIGGIEGLPFQHQAAMHLRFIDGMSNEQIAEAMRLSVDEVHLLFVQAFVRLWELI